MDQLSETCVHLCLAPDSTTSSVCLCICQVLSVCLSRLLGVIPVLIMLMSFPGRFTAHWWSAGLFEALRLSNHRLLVSFSRCCLGRHFSKMKLQACSSVRLGKIRLAAIVLHACGLSFECSYCLDLFQSIAASTRVGSLLEYWRSLQCWVAGFCSRGQSPLIP